MTLREYLQLFRRSWFVILLLPLLGVAAALLLTLFATPAYVATASVLVSARGDGTPGGLQQALAVTTDRAPTYASLATSGVVLDTAAAATGTTTQELQQSVSAVVREGQAYIDVTVQAGEPAQAQARAQAVAEALSQQAPLNDSSGADSALTLNIVTAAALPDHAVTPRPRNNAFIGAVIGLAFGVGAVVVAHSLDSKIRSSSDVPRGLRLASVTSLPVSRGRGTHSVTGETRLESFRHLRANLQFGVRVGGVMALAGVTPASRADDVAVQLAAVLGEIDLTVVVVDADLRLRELPGAGIEPPDAGRGVADVLAGNARIEDALRSTDKRGVWSMPAGAVTPSSAQRVSTPPMREILLTLEHRFDYVLVACPPVLERSEATVVAAASRSSLLIVEAGDTTRAELVQALELFDGIGAQAVSVALNHVRGVDWGHTPSWSGSPEGHGI